MPTSGKTSKIEELTAADWPRLMAEESFPWRHDTGASGRLHEGARLFAWREAAQLVSFGWVTHGPSLLIGELGGRVEFDQPVRWIWDCVTPAAHRGRGFYPQLLAGLVALAGDTRPVIYCTRENSSSQRGIEKAGFVRSFTITEHFLKATHRPGPMPLQYHYHRASQPA
ncbi:MAG: hypothetical protein FJW31_19715 [Acidobacteria bacterium]|nr:hypothetical protein [Acidobacteriota bacterium]